MNENKILIIDIETTDFLNKGGKIVEIGIVELDMETGLNRILFDKVMHERPISLNDVKNSWIIQNSSLSIDEIRHSKQLNDYRDEIQSIINNYPTGATAYNNTFDFGFLDDRGFIFPKKLACPMKLATNVCKIPGKRGGYKWPSVDECFQFLFGKTEYIEKHRGADDAAHESMIVFELFKLGVFKLS